jgi:hypothetical protein
MFNEKQGDDARGEEGRGEGGGGEGDTECPRERAAAPNSATFLTQQHHELATVPSHNHMEPTNRFSVPRRFPCLPREVGHERYRTAKSHRFQTRDMRALGGRTLASFMRSDSW